MMKSSEMDKFFKKLNYTIINQSMMEHLNREHLETESNFYQTNTFNKVSKGCKDPTWSNVESSPPRVLNQIKPPTRKDIFTKYTVKLDKRFLRKAD